MKYYPRQITLSKVLHPLFDLLEHKRCFFQLTLMYLTALQLLNLLLFDNPTTGNTKISL